MSDKALDGIVVVPDGLSESQQGYLTKNNIYVYISNGDEGIDESDRCFCRRSVKTGFSLLEQQFYPVPSCLKGVLTFLFPLRDSYLRIVWWLHGR